MSESNNSINDRILMRLVDGDLSVSEQQRVLSALESEHEGWRRCATAFLEDQALRQTLGQPQRAQAADESVKSARHPTALARISRNRQREGATAFGDWSKLLSLAATILLAFSVGWWAESSREGRRPTVPTLADSGSGGSSGNPTTTVPVGSIADGELAGRYYVNDSRFWEQESVIPADVRRSLQRVGADVRRERGVIPVTLSNGRRISVPYEDVQLVPVSNRSY